MYLPAVDQTEVGLKYRTALGMFAVIVVRWQAWLYAYQIRHNARYNIHVLSWTGPCNTPGPCNTRLIHPTTVNFTHSFCYIYRLYTVIVLSVSFETLLNVFIEVIVVSRTHLV